MNQAQSSTELTYVPLAPGVWDALGKLGRTGFVKRGVANPETVQEHTLALLNLAASLEDLSDKEKDGLLDMLEIHDWPEAIHGDEVILTTDAEELSILKANKFEKEKIALATICKELGEKGEEIMALWLRFETSPDAAASLARQLDKYQAVEKALFYEKEQGIPLFKEFLANERALKRITHPILLMKLETLEKYSKAVC